MGNRINSSAALWAATAVVALATAGCASRGGSGATPARRGTRAGRCARGPARGGSKAGMDAQGNVVDSSKVEAGSGRTVKGLNGYEGEITGNPARNSKFARLQIGMSARQVTDLAGQPTDQGAYVTGKAFIPFYFGSDRHRFEMTYKGQGRLIFAGGGMGDYSSGNLIWIIHNPNESGYR
jgi:outer membrane protein assembly factor BamE (lipoprotein component of BamABCDE complex)